MALIPTISVTFQARALGASLADTRFTAIHASPLKRAYSTAQGVHDAQPEPKPPLTTSLLLREQHWGVAEGHPWIMVQEPGLSLEEHLARGLYPVLHERSQKFPEGESLNDLALRAEQAINEIVMPYVWQAARDGKKGIHIALVSHGLCISELVPALLKKDASGQHIGRDYRGLLNTAWTRVVLDVKGSKEGEPLEFSDNALPPLEVRVVAFNSSEHLEKVKRQHGGIGSAAYDPKQQDIRAFFGGGKIDGGQVEGRSESNAEDEANVQIN
ncbi:hypothetical protein PHLCEN_2v13616 [Hermanssonia centrifuga]|uniref:Phosphoglycerate mutase-like protein n=1 Tax=Hermanssonia centrifuga TaxID=98765 RepID=A0A2R6NDN6_9APHY|nr:hypothetical protein PHLCEN_2v13616 [Hermanssonia centrifuga]